MSNSPNPFDELSDEQLDRIAESSANGLGIIVAVIFILFGVLS